MLSLRLKSDRFKGELSALAPGAFIRQNRIFSSRPNFGINCLKTETFSTIFLVNTAVATFVNFTLGHLLERTHMLTAHSCLVMLTSKQHESISVGTPLGSMAIMMKDGCAEAPSDTQFFINWRLDDFLHLVTFIRKAILPTCPYSLYHKICYFHYSNIQCILRCFCLWA